MKRRTTLIALALLASLGINIGLITHIGTDWRQDRSRPQNAEGAEPRFPIRNFVSGSCEEGFSVRTGAVSAHLQEVAPTLRLTADQTVLANNLILHRAERSCDVRQARNALREKTRNRPFRNPERARDFIGSLLDVRQNVTEAALEENALQRELLSSLSDEQLRSLNLRVLPRLIPGLQTGMQQPQAPIQPQARDNQQASP